MAVLVICTSDWTTQGPMQVRHMVRMVYKFGSVTKGGCFRNGTHNTVNGVLVMDVMQICSVAFTVLIYKQNLVVRIETDNAVLGVEMRSKTHPDMIADHDRITNMQVTHGCERRFGVAGTSHSNVQSGESPCTLQRFERDVTCIGTEVTSLDSEQFVQRGDRVPSPEQEEGTVQGILVGHEVVGCHGVGQNLIPFEWTVLKPLPSAVFEKAVGSFQFSITLRMVGTGEHVIKVQHLGDLTKQLVVLEFRTIIGEESDHTAFMGVEVRDETPHHVISTLVAQRDRPQVTGQHVHDGQCIPVTCRHLGEGANQVHGNELKRLRRYVEVEGVILLGNMVHLLTTWTPFARAFDVVEHAWPPEQAAHELKGSWGAIVTCQVMDLVKHKGNQSGWNHQCVEHLVPRFDLVTQTLIFSQVEKRNHLCGGPVGLDTFQLLDRNHPLTGR